MHFIRRGVLEGCKDYFKIRFIEFRANSYINWDQVKKEFTLYNFFNVVWESHDIFRVTFEEVKQTKLGLILGKKADTNGLNFKADYIRYLRLQAKYFMRK